MSIMTSHKKLTTFRVLCMSKQVSKASNMLLDNTHTQNVHTVHTHEYTYIILQIIQISPHVFETTA